MQVILRKDVETLGDCGDIVNVSDGYYRNYLGPKNLAEIATPGALENRNGQIERIRAKAEKKHQEDLAKSETITSLGVITLEANAGEGGKLFGIITTKELVKILQDKTGLTIDRKNVILDQPINRIGDYTLSVKFSSKVTATVGVQVISAEIPLESA